MNWIKAEGFSLIGGFAAGFAIDIAMLASGDCSIGAAAYGIMFGFPIGNVLGVGIYSRSSLKLTIKAIIFCGILSLILSSAGAFAGLYAMNLLGGYLGFVFALLASSLGCVIGYKLGIKFNTLYGI